MTAASADSDSVMAAMAGDWRVSCFVVLIDGQHINACRDGYIPARARAVRNTVEEKLPLKHHTQTPPCRSLPLKAEKLADPIGFPMSRLCLPYRTAGWNKGTTMPPLRGSV